MSFIGVAPFIALLALAPAQQQQAPGDPSPVVRRLATTARLAADEYRVGVRDGRVIAANEVEEARLFLAEARRTAGLLPAAERAGTIASVDSIVWLIDATASPDTVDARVQLITTAVARRFNVTLDETPAATPSIARGATVYREQCASCHGTLGRGDGPAGATLSPPPANLTDTTLRGSSPIDYYHRITIGVAGTSMPSFESRLSADDRWAAALYASLLRLPAPQGAVPVAYRNFAETARMSDAQLLAATGVTGQPSIRELSHLAAIRSYQADAPGSSGAVFSMVRAQLDTAFALVERGDGAAASTKAFDAYMTFEQVERSVRAKNGGLADQLETAFATVRTRAAGGAAPAELTAMRGELAALLENAERVVGDTPSPFNLFMQSFVLLAREGLEAILIVGALLTFLTKTGAGHRRRDIHIGVGAAVGASLLTAVVLETVFQISPAHREALEGLTMVVATAVLFYVSYWLLSKMEVVKWNHFVRSKVQDAVTGGSALALASAAFLAVYREGFETVLFYKALFISGGAGGTVMPVVAGILAGSAVLVVVYIAINRFGVRLPLKPFFGITSAFLYYMAFVFAGKGIAELQEGGLLPTTILAWAPRVPALGIYPTLESLGAQAVLVLLFVTALIWTFLIEPRRLRVTSELVPDAVGRGAGADAAGEGAP
ncbi:MAG: FTR1 family protein, partial [Gemmatimonadales bacterium]|nr:FTR1 family protein [Gemmatimonadales bacterium]